MHTLENIEIFAARYCWACVYVATSVFLTTNSRMYPANKTVLTIIHLMYYFILSLEYMVASSNKPITRL